MPKEIGNMKEMDWVNMEAYEEAAQDYLRLGMNDEEQLGDAIDIR